MSKQSGLAKRHQEEIDSAMLIAERITRQFYIDTMQIALHRYGKLDLGYQRIMEITDLCEAVRQEYIGSVVRGPEQDVYQHHMDEELKEIMAGRDGFIPHKKRYPELRTISYEGRRRR